MKIIFIICLLGTLSINAQIKSQNNYQSFYFECNIHPNPKGEITEDTLNQTVRYETNRSSLILARNFFVGLNVERIEEAQAIIKYYKSILTPLFRNGFSTDIVLSIMDSVYKRASYKRSKALNVCRISRIRLPKKNSNRKKDMLFEIKLCDEKDNGWGSRWVFHVYLTNENSNKINLEKYLVTAKINCIKYMHTEI